MGWISSLCKAVFVAPAVAIYGATRPLSWAAECFFDWVFDVKEPETAPVASRVAAEKTGVSKDVLIQRARESLGLDSRCYNIAFVGGSGQGKSSLLNALRGLLPEEPGAAKVSAKECTMKATPYRYPGNNRIVFWDLPGSGTEKFPAHTYFEDQHLYCFDCLLIVYKDRITDILTSIAKKAREHELPVALVRTQSDVSINGLLQAAKIPKRERTEKVLEKFAETYRLQMETDAAKLNGYGRLFLVTTYGSDKYNELEEWPLVLDESKLRLFIMGTMILRKQGSLQPNKGIDKEDASALHEMLFPKQATGFTQACA